jgi:hypothetical protein
LTIFLSSTWVEFLNPLVAKGKMSVVKNKKSDLLNIVAHE